MRRNASKLAEFAATEVGILQRYKPLPPPPEPEPIRLSAQIRRYLDQIDTLKKPGVVPWAETNS